jgi:hypothetical protein
MLSWPCWQVGPLPKDDKTLTASPRTVRPPAPVIVVAANSSGKKSQAATSDEELDPPAPANPVLVKA